MIFDRGLAIAVRRRASFAALPLSTADLLPGLVIVVHKI